MWANNVCSAAAATNCSAVPLFGGSQSQVQTDLAACETVSGCSYNYQPVTIPESVLAGIAALTWSSGLNKGYGSEHACTLYDIAQSQGSSGPSAASSGHTYSSSGSGSCSNGQSYAERCAVFQAAVAGFTFVAAATSSDIDRCLDFDGNFMSFESACENKPTGFVWAPGGGSATPLVIQGQQAGGSNCTDSAGNAVGCDGGDVILRPGAASVNGNEGAVKLQNAAGNDIVTVSGTSVQIQTGMKLSVAGTLESVGQYVAVPDTAAVNIDSHGDAISGAQQSAEDGSGMVYVDITKEFVVLNCDDNSANMRDVINPVFPPGANGQVVHVINIGEDYCQMQRGGPSQAPYNAKFRTINNVDRACLKSSADGGGIMTFMYYYANGVGGWQQMTPAPTEC